MCDIFRQEVDHYYDFLLPEMNKLGYTGHFAPKPTSACLEGLSLANSTADGCVMFLNTRKFNIISCETKTLALSVAGLADGELLEDDRNIKTQNQVALFAVCEFITDKASLLTTIDQNPPPPLIICTTHLKSAKTTVGELYRQKAILQVLDMVENLYCKFADGDRTPAVLITGDFNAVPEATSYAPPLTYQAVKSHPLLLRSIYNDDAKFSLFPLSNSLFTTWKARHSSYESSKQRDSSFSDYTSELRAQNLNIPTNVRPKEPFSTLTMDYGNSSSFVTTAAGSKETVVRRCIDYIFYCPFIGKNSKISEAITKNDDDEIGRLMGEELIDEEMTFYSTGDLSMEKIPSGSQPSSAMPLLTPSGDNFRISFGHATTVRSPQQVTLSLLLRFVIYFLNSLLPITALLNSDMNYNEVLQVVGMSLLGLFMFEYLLVLKPTPFNPIIPSQVNIEIESIAVLPMISRQKLVSKATALGKRILTRNMYVSGRPGLHPIALLDISADDEIGPELMPSMRYPSDHLAVAADFQVLWELDENGMQSSRNNK